MDSKRLTDERLKELAKPLGDNCWGVTEREGNEMARELLLLRADAAELARHLHHARHCPYGIGRTKSGNEPWVESPCCCGVAELLSRPTVVELLKEKG